MSPSAQNIQESCAQKRSHDDFTTDDGDVKMEDAGLKTASQLPVNGDQQSPRDSPGLTEAGSSTPARNSPSPLTPSQAASPTQSKPSSQKPDSKSTTQPVASAPLAKRVRLTAEEKERKEKELAQRKKEREEQLKQKAEAKAKLDQEKAEAKAKLDQEKIAKAQEREEKKKKKEEEEKLKAEQKEEKKRQKEEEQKKKTEAEEKKKRQQPTVASFFGGAKVSAKPAALTEASPQTTPKKIAVPKSEKSEYERRFIPFFVRSDMRMASHGIGLTEEARERKSNALDQYVKNGKSWELKSKPDPVELLGLSERPKRRGLLHHPVRHIVETREKNLQSPGADEAMIITMAKSRLDKIPLKIIAFSQDVRPPYYGTATYKPFLLGKDNIHTLARKPIGRKLQLDYDYDSEAEWQEEEGEDVDIDDDEDELDEEDDMDGFLDDSEDALVGRRIFANALEPESTGVCFEGEDLPNAVLYDHKMEYIHDAMSSSISINPWSTSYWEPEPKKVAPKATIKTEVAAAMLPPPAPGSSNAFDVLSKPATTATEAPKLVKDEILDDVKKAIIDNKQLSKVGIIDYIYQQFRDRTSRAEVKNTLERVAEKKGTGRSKEWELKPGYELKA